MSDDEIGKGRWIFLTFSMNSRENVSIKLIVLPSIPPKSANIISIFPIPIFFPIRYNREQMRAWKRSGEWPQKNTRFLIRLQAISQRWIHKSSGSQARSMRSEFSNPFRPRTQEEINRLRDRKAWRKRPSMDRTVPPGICLCARSFQAFRSAFNDGRVCEKIHEWHGYHSAPLSFRTLRSGVEKYHFSMVQRALVAGDFLVQSFNRVQSFSTHAGTFPTRDDKGTEILPSEKIIKKAVKKWFTFITAPFYNYLFIRY